MYNWDYQIDQNWQPKTDQEWQWYLTRVINYGMTGRKLDTGIVRKYLPKLKIDENKRLFLQLLLDKDEKNT